MRFLFCASRYFAAFLFSIILPSIVPAQSAATSQAQPPSDAALMGRLVTLRDAFVSQIKAEGFKPSLPPPEILVDNPPSYGRYENDKNLLHISAWDTLQPDQEARFVRLADMLHNGESAQQLFEEGVYQWVFVHELSHWWQACQHKITDDHYAVEFGANRIAAAFWRWKDPAFMERRTKHFRAILALAPNPLPPGESKEKFFNANYEKIAGTPVYTWFQSSMVVDVSDETPPPSFRQALQ
jgi:hypothetical protein